MADSRAEPALPPAFLHSLRTLFDILDDGRRGHVHLSEIESRWRGAGARDLPAGVLESLRRVASRRGCLTFERFVAGLRYSMFDPEAQHQQPKTGRALAAKVRPLGPSNGTNTGHNSARTRKHCDPARYSQENASDLRSIESVPQESLAGPKTAESLAPTRSQRELMTGFTRIRDQRRRHTITNGVDYGMCVKVSTGQMSEAPPLRCLSLAPPCVHTRSPSLVSVFLCWSAAALSLPLMVVSRLGPRGLDTAVWAAYSTVFIPLSSGLFSSRALHFYLWLKQMKELEQEKDSLLAGLDVLERAREWYQTQIHNITETQRHVGQSRHSTEFLAEPCQSRLDVLLPKLQEVTRCLSDLISFTGKTFPSTGSLSAGVSSSAAPPQAIHTLKEHNRLLTQEVSEKSERIAQLEQEKCALIKQLFEARARNAHDSSALDSTFI